MHVSDFASARPRSDAVLVEGSRSWQRHHPLTRTDRRQPIALARTFTIVSIALSLPSGDQLGYAMCEFEA